MRCQSEARRSFDFSEICSLGVAAALHRVVHASMLELPLAFCRSENSGHDALLCRPPNRVASPLLSQPFRLQPDQRYGRHGNSAADTEQRSQEHQQQRAPQYPPQLVPQLSDPLIAAASAMMTRGVPVHAAAAPKSRPPSPPTAEEGEQREGSKPRPVYSNSPKEDLIINWADEESEGSCLFLATFQTEASEHAGAGVVRTASLVTIFWQQRSLSCRPPLQGLKMRSDHSACGGRHFAAGPAAGQPEKRCAYSTGYVAASATGRGRATIRSSRHLQCQAGSGRCCGGQDKPGCQSNSICTEPRPGG